MAFKVMFFNKVTQNETLLACLPLGTGCDFVKTIGIPNNIRKIFRSHINQNVIKCDVGQIEFNQNNEFKKKVLLILVAVVPMAETIQVINDHKNKFLGRKSTF